MPSVRCPNCDTAQHVEAGAHGYTCSSCGKEWAFVVCRSCGSRFHAKPGATTWTCPRCGLLQEASAEPPPPLPAEPVVAAPKPMTITDADLDVPQEPAGSMFPPGLGLGRDEEGPEDAFAMPTRESSGPPVWLYVVGAVVAIVAAFLLFRVAFGGDDEPTPSGDQGTQVTAQQATETMCGHVQQGFQTYRDDALGAAAEELKADAKALRQANAQQAAKQVKSLIAAIADAREALATQADTDESFAAVRAAITKLPC